VFGIEDFSGKLNGNRVLQEFLDPEHRGMGSGSAQPVVQAVVADRGAEEPRLAGCCRSHKRSR
jgi:hypothetical protein